MTILISKYTNTYRRALERKDPNIFVSLTRVTEDRIESKKSKNLEAMSYIERETGEIEE